MGLHRASGPGRAGAGGRVRVMGIRNLPLVALLALSIVSVAGAQATEQAPSFTSGPELVSGGLLWSDYSSGKENVLLSTATGTRVLIAGAGLSAVVVEDGWIVVTGPSGPRVGRIGRRLKAIPGLRGCPPIRGAGASESTLESEYRPFQTHPIVAALSIGSVIGRPRLGHLHGVLCATTIATSASPPGVREPSQTRTQAAWRAMHASRRGRSMAPAIGRQASRRRTPPASASAGAARPWCASARRATR